MRFAFLVVLAVLVAAAAGPGAGAATLSADDIRTGRAAFEAGGKGNWRKARSLAARVDDPLAAKLVWWFAVTRPGGGADFDEIAAFIEANPDWPEPDLLRRRAEEAMGPGLGADAVLAWFDKRPPVTTKGRVRRAEALIAAGRADDGRAALREAWVEGRFTKREEKAFYRRHRKVLTADDHVRRLDRLLWAGANWPARRMLWKVDAGHRALGEARLLLRHMQGNVDAAIAKVPEALRDDPGLVYERLRWRRKKGKTMSARDWLDRHPLDAVKPELWGRERAALARSALEDGHVSEAYRIAAGHALDDGVGFAEAEWLAGWIALRFLEEPNRAKDHFVTLFDGVRYPVSRARAAYWAGRAAEAGGEPKSADLWYRAALQHPTTYYGQLAAAHVRPRHDLELPPEPGPDAEEATAFAGHELTRAVRMLAAFGATARVEPFVRRLAALRDSAGWMALAADLAGDVKRPDLAITVAKRAIRHGRPLVDAGYPVRPVPTTGRKKVEAVEDALVLAMVRQESAFRVEATSSAGARGLMQLLPATARKVAKDLKLRYSRSRLTKDPEFNLVLGRAYIGGLLDDFDGSYVLALAAYNAGPKRVRAWVRAAGDPREGLIDAIDWIETIPFAETRNYVQRTLENLQVYRRKTGPTEVAMTLASDLER